jgi:microcystin-dependent protein
MATVTPSKTFTSNEIVTPANLNLLGTPTVALADSEVTTVKIADAAVTTPKLATSTQQALLPAGAIMPFAMNSAPSGWLAANGLAVSRTTYAALFAAIGTTYGAGDGSTTFALPDLRGYFVRGSGTNSDGVAAGTFGAKQADAVGPHTHSGTTGDDSPDHTHSIERGTSNGGHANSGAFSAPAAGTSGGASTRHQHTFTSSSQSPAGTTETRPRNIAMLYCIKA